MDKVTLQVVPHCPEGVDPEVYEAAKKAGDIEVYPFTAKENIRNSGGIFEIKPDASDPTSQLFVLASTS